MEGIAKTAQRAEIKTEPIIHTVADPINTICYEEVPVDVFRFFNLLSEQVDNKELDMLKDISKWAFEGVETLGDGLRKLKQLEIQLGVPTGNDRRHDKMWRWIKMQRQIDELRKRQEAV
ncbi:MAG: hypothetical protein ACTSUF_10280 [Candidatus Heimdallarchaeaceae archaeon]